MANANQITVDYNDMQRVATRLTTGQTNITTEMNTLKKEISTLTGGAWSTPQASEAYNTLFTQYSTNAQKVIDTLNDLSAFITKAKDAMHTTDQDIAAAAQKSLS